MKININILRHQTYSFSSRRGQGGALNIATPQHIIYMYPSIECLYMYLL